MRALIDTDARSEFGKVKRVFEVRKLTRYCRNRSSAKLMFLSLRILLLVWLYAGAGSIAFGQVIWSDEFDTGTALDSVVWSYDLGADGWGNRELQEYTSNPENVRIEGGNLVISVQEIKSGDTDRRFTSARVRTEDKLTFKYGTIEARIKIPDLADGLWPAFWTLGNNFSQVGWPSCGELDITEMGSSSAIMAGVINRRVGSAAHWDNQGSWADYAQFLDTASNLDDGFHIFSMNWTPERITTYVDGRQIWTFYIKNGFCAGCSEFHQPHFLILNLAVGGTHTGLLSSNQVTATTPAEMLIDYIRISDNGFTELGGSSISGETPAIGPEYSGSWYYPEQDGHGFSMEFGEQADGSPLAVVYWYTYDSAGNPIFMIGSGEPDDDTLEVQFVSPYGMNYGEFDPDTVVREVGGTARFEFADKENAIFSYTPSDFSVSAWGHTPVESLSLFKLFAIPVSNFKSTPE
jgi:beta-glucanase (GH16 family)